MEKDPEKEKAITSPQENMKFNKNIDAGYTHIAFIQDSDKDEKIKKEVYLIGTCKNYFDVDDKSPGNLMREHKPTIRDKDYKGEVIMKEIMNYKPIHVSCYRYTTAILYRKDKSVNKNDKIVKRFAVLIDLFQEIKNNLKSKNLSFQTYYLNNLTNKSSSSCSSCSSCCLSGNGTISI
mgnify:CR=1 FL=1